MYQQSDFAFVRRPVDRRAVAVDLATSLFRQCADQPSALTKFEARLCSNGFRYLGRGVSRKVFTKSGIVVKVAHRPLSNGQDQNNTEAENSRRHPRLTPPLYVHLRSQTEGKNVWGGYIENGHLNVLIARKVGIGTPHKYDAKDYLRLARTFDDLHGNNIGHLGRKLVALDTGYRIAD